MSTRRLGPPRTAILDDGLAPSTVPKVTPFLGLVEKISASLPIVSSVHGKRIRAEEDLEVEEALSDEPPPYSSSSQTRISKGLDGESD